MKAAIELFFLQKHLSWQNYQKGNIKWEISDGKYQNNAVDALLRPAPLTQALD